jgi:uncharacterized protein YeeX (DUF496 family)
MTAPKPPKASKQPPKGVGSTAPKPAKTDWEAIERDYRTGKFTLRELEDKHGANNSTISRNAKRKGWTQDLSTAIKQATNAKLIAAVITEKCSDAQQSAANTVLAAAEVNKDVIMAHRTGLKRITKIQQKLLDQIEQAAENMPDLEDVIEMLRNPDENGVDRANDMMRKAMARGSLVDDLKKLTEVDERVRKGEREAFGLDDEGDDGKGDPRGGKSMTDAERAVRLAAMLAKGAKL